MYRRNYFCSVNFSLKQKKLFSFKKYEFPPLKQYILLHLQKNLNQYIVNKLYDFKDRI